MAAGILLVCSHHENRLSVEASRLLCHHMPASPKFVVTVFTMSECPVLHAQAITGMGRDITTSARTRPISSSALY